MNGSGTQQCMQQTEKLSTGNMEDYCEFVRHLRVVDMKRVLRQHGLCEYGMRSTLILRIESLLAGGKQQQQKQHALLPCNNNNPLGYHRKRSMDSDDDEAVSHRKGGYGSNVGTQFVLKNDSRSSHKTSRLVFPTPPTLPQQQEDRVMGSHDSAQSSKLYDTLGEGILHRQRVHDRLTSSGSESGQSPRESVSSNRSPLSVLSDSFDCQFDGGLPDSLSCITDNLLDLRPKVSKPKVTAKQKPEPSKPFPLLPLKPNLNFGKLVYDYDTRLETCRNLSAVETCDVLTFLELQSAELKFGASPPTVVSKETITLTLPVRTEVTVCGFASGDIHITESVSPSIIATGCIEPETSVASYKPQFRVGMRPIPVPTTKQSKLSVNWKAIQRKVKSIPKLFGKQTLRISDNERSSASGDDSIDKSAAVGKSYKRLISDDFHSEVEASSPAKKLKTEPESPTRTFIGPLLQTAEDDVIDAAAVRAVNVKLEPTDTPESDWTDTEETKRVTGDTKQSSPHTQTGGVECTPCKSLTDSTENSDSEPLPPGVEVIPLPPGVEVIPLPPGVEVIPLPPTKPKAASTSESKLKRTNTSSSVGKPSAAITPMVKREPTVPVDTLCNQSKQNSVSQHQQYQHQQYQHQQQHQQYGHPHPGMMPGGYPHQWSGGPQNPPYNYQYPQGGYYDNAPGYPGYSYQYAPGSVGPGYNMPGPGPYHNADLMGAWNNGWNHWYM